MKNSTVLVMGLLLSTSAFAESILTCKTDVRSRTPIQVEISTTDSTSIVMTVDHPLAGVMHQTAKGTETGSPRAGGGTVFESKLGKLEYNGTTSPNADGTRRGVFTLKSLNQKTDLNCSRSSAKDATATDSKEVAKELAEKMKSTDVRTKVTEVENKDENPCMPEGKSLQIELQVRQAYFDREKSKIVYKWETVKTVGVDQSGQTSEVCAE
jgi:hypothetical protein